jgi:hypothetical protein
VFHGWRGCCASVNQNDATNIALQMLPDNIPSDDSEALPKSTFKALDFILGAIHCGKAGGKSDASRCLDLTCRLAVIGVSMGEVTVSNQDKSAVDHLP